MANFLAFRSKAFELMTAYELSCKSSELYHFMDVKGNSILNLSIEGIKTMVALPEKK